MFSDTVNEAMKTYHPRRVLQIANGGR